MSGLLEIVSFNVRGIRDRRKRRTIFRHMHVKYSKHIVFLQETHSSKEDENKWRAEWGADIYFAHGDKSSRGVCALFPRNFGGEIVQAISEHDGRTILLSIVFQNLCIQLVGIYAPTQSNDKEQTCYFSTLKNALHNVDYSQPMILCGDMNVHMSADDTDHVRYRNSESCKIVREIMFEHNLIDVWRYLNPAKKMYTWRRMHPFQQSRIDYFLVSEELVQVHKVELATIDSGVKSDHNIIRLALSLGQSKRGPGLWRFNNMLLDDVYLSDQIRREILAASRQVGDYAQITNKGLLLEVLLSNVRVHCICRSSHLAKERRRKEEELESKVAQLEGLISNNCDPVALEQYLEAKRTLDQYKCRAAEKAMMYCKAKWLEQGEKPTKYFLNLEKKRSMEKTIYMLVNNQDEYVTGDKEILRMCKNFFEDLHASRFDSDVQAYMHDTPVPKLSERDRDLCEGPITFSECHEALKSMGANKAPSVSGFSKEFMLFYWSEIGEIITQYINDAYNSGKLFITQRRGVLTLIPKSGDQKNLRNKRPICLLDIVYKIIAKVIANRLSAVINKIVHTDQTGFIKRRSIQDNLRTIGDVIDYAEKDDLPGLLCALDFKSAFNSINHQFMFHALKLFGFGDSFVKWIALLYNDNELAVINNGYTSEWFKPKRGIMQGCPISGMLFNLAVELLAIQVRSSEKIKGICISGQEVKISQYADDATVFVRDEESVKELMDVLKNFSEVSGLELNVNKSKLMWIGSTRHNMTGLFGMPAVRRLKILGVYFSALDSCQKENYEPILKSMKATMNMWMQRSLSIKGRITVSKSLLISKMIFLVPCVAMDTAMLRQIQSHIMKFLWRGRPPKVAAKSLCQSIKDGGLGAIDVCHLYESMRASWVRKMYSNVPWARILRARCGTYDIRDLLNSRFQEKDLIKLGFHRFYVQVLMRFRAINKLNVPSTYGQIMREYIWFNEFIKRDTKSVFEESMYKCGIRYIGDLIDSRGSFLRYEELKQKFPSIRVNVLKYMGIISAIPTSWKMKVIGTPKDINLNCTDRKIRMKNESMSLEKIEARSLYDMGLQKCIPTALKRWEHDKITPQDWPTTLCLPYKCTRSTRIQSFHFQLIHRYIPTKKFLHLRGLASSPRCGHCNNVDNLVHHFCMCPMVRSLWNDIFAYINRRCNRTLQPNIKNILFGVENVPTVVNIMIMIGKMYVHSCHSRECYFDFNSYLELVKDEYLMEKRIAADCPKKRSELSKRWRIVGDICS